MNYTFFKIKNNNKIERNLCHSKLFWEFISFDFFFLYQYYTIFIIFLVFIYQIKKNSREFFLVNDFFFSDVTHAKA